MIYERIEIVNSLETEHDRQFIMLKKNIFDVSNKLVEKFPHMFMENGPIKYPKITSSHTLISDRSSSYFADDRFNFDNSDDIVVYTYDNSPPPITIESNYVGTFLVMYLKDGSMLSFYLLPFGYNYCKFNVFEKRYSNNTDYSIDGRALQFPGLGIGFIPANGYVKREPLPLYSKKITSRSNEEVYVADLDKEWNLGSPYITNAVKDIICINDNTFALSLGNIYYTEKDYYSPGIIIITKTMKDKIAIIMPSASAETDDIVKIAGFNDVYRNSLVAVTYESKFAPYRYDNSCASLNDIPKNCNTSAGTVAAIANPPGIPAANDAIEDWLVLFIINLLAIALISSLDTPAPIGPLLIILSSISTFEENPSAKNLFLSTFTPGI